jgi:hypothetical protein
VAISSFSGNSALIEKYPLFIKYLPGSGYHFKAIYA